MDSARSGGFCYALMHGPLGGIDGETGLLFHYCNISLYVPH